MTNQTCYYHYTSIAALLSIINSEKVWFTDHRFLNDRYEIKHGLEKLLSYFPNEKESFIKAFELHNTQTSYCILSLSKSPEELTQWQKYAEDGGGVSIGFNKQLMEYARPELKLVACNYDNTVSERLADKHRDFIKSVPNNTEHNENNSMGRIVAWLEENKPEFEACVQDTMNIKNNAFKNEQEVRAVIAIPTNKIEMRVSDERMIPYVEIPLWGEKARLLRGELVDISQVIHEIWLGPKCHDLNKTAIRMLNIKSLGIEKYDCGYI